MSMHGRQVKWSVTLPIMKETMEQMVNTFGETLLLSSKVNSTFVQPCQTLSTNFLKATKGKS